ncbi:GNAT family N-acetyltransferase [Verrucomicrobiota bacterium sgz303538]
MLLEAPSALKIDGPFAPAEVSYKEWSALWQRSPSASIFQSPAWVHAWWTHFGGSTPLMLTFRHSGQLAGIAPLFLWPEERRVLLIGTGITDSLDVLAEAGQERAIAEATLQWLDECRTEWDVCDFQQLPQGSALVNAPTPSHWTESRIAQDINPALSLPAEFEAVPRAAELAYLHRRLEKEGLVEYVTCTSENFSELFESLIQLHGARWTQCAQSGVLAETQVQEFHADAARGLLRLGALRLYVLKVAGSAVAAYYGFHHRRRAVYYLGGFDPAWKRFSVGSLIVGHAIAEAIRQGAQEFDFGRGGESYKYRWGAKDRVTYQRELRA